MPKFKRTKFKYLVAASIVLHALAASAEPARPAKLPSVMPAEAPTPEDPDYINPDRPGIADGPNVVGPGRVQIETGVQIEYHKNSTGRQHLFFVPALLRIGLDKKWEVRVEGNTYARLHSLDVEGEKRSEGIAPTSIGVKYHFTDSSGPAHPALAAIVRAFPPSGSRDFKTTHATGDVRLVANWDFAPRLSLTPNVGIARYEGDNGETFTAGLFASTLTFGLSKTFSMFVDSGIQTPEAKHGRASVIFDTGIAFILGSNTQLDLSVGTGATGLTTPRPFISVGISHRL